MKQLVIRNEDEVDGRVRVMIDEEQELSFRSSLTSVQAS